MILGNTVVVFIFLIQSLDSFRVIRCGGGDNIGDTGRRRILFFLLFLTNNMFVRLNSSFAFCLAS